MRTKAIETKDERAVGQLVFLVLLLAKCMEEALEKKKFGEGMVKEQLSREFEWPVAKLEAAARKAEEDLPSWLCEIRRNVVGQM